MSACGQPKKICHEGGTTMLATVHDVRPYKIAIPEADLADMMEA
jgi:hypothetical protein